jgi:hypothetical protein
MVARMTEDQIVECVRRLIEHHNFTDTQRMIELGVAIWQDSIAAQVEAAAAKEIPVLTSFLDDRTRQLYFCRGPVQCTRPNVSMRRKRCPDCVLGREGETIQQLIERMKRGDS